MKKGISLILTFIMVLGILTSVPVTVNAASAADLTFELNEDGNSYSVKRCDISAEGEIVIPDTYGGLPVTRISQNAFMGCEYVTEVTIPDGVTNIGACAFMSCTNIKSIEIPDSVITIEGSAFWNCQNLESVKIPIGITSILNETFYCCSSLTSIEIPDSVINIDAYAFYGCSNLTSITIPDNVKYIGDRAFASCKKLSSLKIGTGVQEIDILAFGYCDNLISVIIPENVNTIIECAFGYCYDDNFATVKKQGFTIYGKKDTTAETYANENGFTFIELCEHKSTKWITDKKATCTKEGSKHKECTECKEVLETAKIAKTKHTAGSWKTEKKATVDKVGKKVKKCTECGKTLDTATIKQLKCSKPKVSKIENTSDGVKITWGKVSGADSYTVYRKTSSGSYSKIGTTTRTYYTDKKASSGKKYHYLVKAVNEAGSSDSSKAKSILYLADTTLKTPKSTKKGIKLEWSKVSGADGYMVYRKTGSGSYSKIATVKGYKKITYTDKKAKKGKTYTYKVKAYKSKTYSAYSNTKKIKDKY